MQLTRGERKRLVTLLACHQRPPTWAGLLPKGIMLVTLFFGLFVGFAILVEGVGSPLMYYFLGFVSAFPLQALSLIHTNVRRWRLNEAVINWDRVEELLAEVERPGE